MTPAFAREPLLNRPVTAMNGHGRTVGPDALGTPLYVRRSRMSDAPPVRRRRGHADRCRAHVAAPRRRAASSTAPDWRARAARDRGGGAAAVFERDDERARRSGRSSPTGGRCLNERLRTTDGAARRAAVGHRGRDHARGARSRRGTRPRSPSARWRRRRPRGRRSLTADALNSKFLTCLPGRGRQWFSPPCDD